MHGLRKKEYQPGIQKFGGRIISVGGRAGGEGVGKRVVWKQVRP